jgi:Xaa-Pro dipeptidase
MPVNRERATAIMHEHRLDAIVTMTPENLTYLADFPLLRGCLSETRVYCIFPAAADHQPSVVMPKLSVDMLTSSTCPVEDIWLYGNAFLFEAEGWKPQTAEERRLKAALSRRPFHRLEQEALLAALKDRGLEQARIGFDEKALSSPDRFDQFEALVPKAEVVPAYSIIRKIRMVKTAEELRRMRLAAAANEAGAKTLFAAAKVGVPETELAHAYYAGLAAAHAQPHHLSIGCGRRHGFPNGEPTDYRLQSGDVIRFDADCVVQCYFNDIARNAVVGEPSAKLKACHAGVVAGLETAAALTRPGVKASEIFRAGVEEVRKRGIPQFDRHHIGHAIGCVCHDDPRIAPGDHTPLEEAMVINIEMPYYELGFGGAHVENTFLITKAGCECLHRMSLELQRVG